jgi:D-glycero-D-manno-heptose 1,7-bisphosphate phosphatase
MQVIVITNQGGIALGHVTRETVIAQHVRMNQLIADAGGIPLTYEICPHAPSDNCTCRKPKPAMIQYFTMSVEVNARKSYMIGDDPRDMEAAANAEIRWKFMVKSDRYDPSREVNYDFLLENFKQAAELIILLEKARCEF